MKTLIDIIRPN